MKFVKWKILMITCLVCLCPILLGVSLWDKLPEVMAIHFDINNTPDNFASKNFVVFFMPLLMLPLQIFCCVINDINSHKYGPRIKLETATKWIIPVMSIVVHSATVIYGINDNLDIRKIAVFIVGCVFVVVGNFLPKFDYLGGEDSDKIRKINRFVGYASIIMGILFFASMFLPPVASIVCLFLLVPYAIITIVYGIFADAKK